MRTGNIILDILNDRFSDMGIVTSVSTDTSYNREYVSLDITLNLHRPLQYLNLREVHAKDAADEWIVDILDESVSGSPEGTLLCHICDTRVFLHISEMTKHHYCFYCGRKLAFSLEDITEIHNRENAIS